MLINCRECGSEVSDKATSCPHCNCANEKILGDHVVCSECKFETHDVYPNCTNCGAPSSYFESVPAPPKRESEGDLSHADGAIESEAEPIEPLAKSTDSPLNDSPKESKQRGSGWMPAMALLLIIGGVVGIVLLMENELFPGHGSSGNFGSVSHTATCAEQFLKISASPDGSARDVSFSGEITVISRREPTRLLIFGGDDIICVLNSPAFNDLLKSELEVQQVLGLIEPQTIKCRSATYRHDVANGRTIIAHGCDLEAPEKFADRVAQLDESKPQACGQYIKELSIDDPLRYGPASFMDGVIALGRDDDGAFLRMAHEGDRRDTGFCDLYGNDMDELYAEMGSEWIMNDDSMSATIVCEGVEYYEKPFEDELIWRTAAGRNCSILEYDAR